MIKEKRIPKVKFIIISLLLVSMLTIFCWDDDPPPPPVEWPPDSTGCGVGSGDFSFSLVGTLPESFDCNDSGRFVLTFRPNIDDSYYGTGVFNRLYFTLDNGYFGYSNYVQFESGAYADKELEWGGSLPSGDYEVVANMKNIQLNSTCRDSIAKWIKESLGCIHIIQYSNPQKLMEIEYDCQLSDTSYYRYDVFMSTDLERKINIAFNIANTACNINIDNRDLLCSMVLWDPNGVPPFQEARNYVEANKNEPERMYFCGIKGFKDALGNFLPKYRAISLLRDTTTFEPSPRSGSLVAVKAIINHAATFYDLDFHEELTATAIHELGHQRGIPGHEGCSSRFCVMSGDVIQSYHNTYSNPHFCENCIYKIKNIEW